MTIDNFDRFVSATIYSRGYAYWADGRVEMVENEGDVYIFHVRGTDTYEVEIGMDRTGNIDYHYCDCPYDGSICKHEVACLLYLNAYMQSDPKDYGEILDKFTDKELSYLYYYAYTGEGISQNPTPAKCPSLPSENGHWQPTVTDCRKISQMLRNHGWAAEAKDLHSGWRSAIGFKVPHTRALEAMMHMYRNHPRWASRIIPSSRRDPDHVVISLIAKHLVTGKEDFSILQKESFPAISEDMCSALEYALDIEESRNLPALLPGNLMSALIGHEVHRMKAGGDAAALRRAHEYMMAIPKPGDEMIPSHADLRMYWYYTSGELIDPMPGEDQQASFHFLNAALQLIHGNVDDALKEFRLATNLQPHQKYSAKDIPLDPISLYLFICALAISKSDTDMALLGKIPSKIKRTDLSSYDCFSLLVNTILGKPQNKNNYFWSTQRSNPLQCTLGKVIYAYAFGMEPLCKIMPGTTIGQILSDTSEYSLLHNEMKALAGNGETGLITKIGKRQIWESELGELIELLSPSKATASSGERLIYYSPYRSETIEVRIQGKLKSGGYSRGKTLSASKYSACDCPMDETDIAIHKAWERHGKGSLPTLSDVLPYCEGTDKLFTDSDWRDFTAVNVVKEKPYLSTIRKDGHISFCSNVPQEILSRSNGALPYRWSEDKKSITFWPMGQSETTILDRLIKLKSVPQEAEPMLESLFAPLQGRLEIQSDVKGGIQLERREGSTVLCARLRREMNHYLVTFLAHPLEGGSVYLKPGEGSEVVLDGNADGRFEVVRDLKKEKKVLGNAKAILECTGSEDAFVMPSDLLYALENPSDFKEVFYLEWPEGQELRLNSPSISDFQINATGKGGWFELEGELKVSEDIVLSVAQLLEITRGNARFIKLGENEYFHLSEQLRGQLRRLDSVSQKSRNKLIVPQLAMSMIADGVDDILDIDGDDALQERRKLIREASKKDFPIPDGLNAVLRPYQEDGYRWMMRLSHWHAGACLADDMGLGKTVQTIAFLLAKASLGPQLVVAPTSVAGNWEAEIHRFAPSLSVLMTNTLGVSERNEAVASAGSGTVVITTYGVLASASETFSKVEWATAVLDEAHTIKNKETKMSAAVMDLKAAARVILTGTPIQNHLGELWNLFRFINPDLLGSFDHFQQTYVANDCPESRDTLKRLVSPFMLRRTKTEVARELPEKTEIIIPVELNESEMAVYEVLRREAKSELEGSGALSMNALAMMTKLRMASCSASLVENSWKGTDSKLNVFVQKLQDIVDGGNNVLVFSQFTSFLTLAKKQAEEVGIKNYLYLDGSTPAAKRRKMVEQFQNGSVPVFFISLKAGGLGLNLTGANYVIHLDPWWNPAIEQQATDRTYRIGQQQKVTVYHLISSGTIEEKILRLHSTKQQLADAILSGASASHRLTAEEILELIR